MVTTRPMQRSMNMMNMPRMPPGVASFNLASQANMAGGMHPGGIPMQRVPGMSPHQQQQHTPRVNGSIPDVTDATLDHE
ncbi:hypothetical protein Syun_006742 [Stephania yunnanensis]|uniref:Uncharacterized protein n=1 Tax=Stephania yunnanensis TaxID=152371 RepID=A0AAP0KXC9_9MAGN